MLVTRNPIPGSTYNIGGSYSCTIKKLLRNLIRLSKVKNKNNIRIKIDKKESDLLMLIYKFQALKNLLNTQDGSLK